MTLPVDMTLSRVDNRERRGSRMLTVAESPDAGIRSSPRVGVVTASRRRHRESASSPRVGVVTESRRRHLVRNGTMASIRTKSSINEP